MRSTIPDYVALREIPRDGMPLRLQRTISDDTLHPGMRVRLYELANDAPSGPFHAMTVHELATALGVSFQRARDFRAFHLENRTSPRQAKADSARTLFTIGQAHRRALQRRREQATAAP